MKRVLLKADDKHQVADHLIFKTTEFKKIFFLFFHFVFTMLLLFLEFQLRKKSIVKSFCFLTGNISLEVPRNANRSVRQN